MIGLEHTLDIHVGQDRYLVEVRRLKPSDAMPAHYRALLMPSGQASVFLLGQYGAKPEWRWIVKSLVANINHSALDTDIYRQFPR